MSGSDGDTGIRDDAVDHAADDASEHPADEPDHRSAPMAAADVANGEAGALDADPPGRASSGSHTRAPLLRTRR